MNKQLCAASTLYYYVINWQSRSLNINVSRTERQADQMCSGHFFKPSAPIILSYILCIVGDLRDLLCRFVYNCEIWHRCRSDHNKFIFWGRQSRRSLGPPYWLNPRWPPLVIWFVTTTNPKVIGLWIKTLLVGFWPQGFQIYILFLHIMTDLLV